MQAHSGEPVLRFAVCICCWRVNAGVVEWLHSVKSRQLSADVKGKPIAGNLSLCQGKNTNEILEGIK